MRIGRWIVILLLVSSGGVSAEAPVRLVTGSDYRPYSDVTLEAGGLATLLVQKAFESAGRETAAVEFQPWMRGLQETQDGHFDATFPYAETPERRQNFLFSQPIVEVEEAFFARQSFAGDILIPGTLSGKHVCRPTGYNTELLKELTQQGWPAPDREQG